MRLLNGSELAGFIQQRQAQQVRVLRQSSSVVPRLAIVRPKDDPVIDTYIRLKQRYGEEIGIETDVYRPTENEIPTLLAKLNADDSVHGIIVQLPLPDPSKTDEVVNMVTASKDVDALGKNAQFDAATPMAIMWLLAGYNVDLRGKKVVLVGKGRLVGAPLEKLLLASDIPATVIDKETPDIAAAMEGAEVIISATGNPGIITSEIIPKNAVVVDAGVASEDGRTVGDIDPKVYERDDLTITPQKGGVGPLTVCALFENVIRATQRKT